jgi:hypothetical protein
MPPSMISSVPSRKRDSLEAKYTAAPTISSGAPKRPAGILRKLAMLFEYE